MDRTNDRVTCDRCGATAQETKNGMLPEKWQWIVLNVRGQKPRILCEACNKSVLAFIDRKDIQP
jgi:hypothetical protein